MERSTTGEMVVSSTVRSVPSAGSAATRWSTAPTADGNAGRSEIGTSWKMFLYDTPAARMLSTVNEPFLYSAKNSGVSRYACSASGRVLHVPSRIVRNGSNTSITLFGFRFCQSNCALTVSGVRNTLSPYDVVYHPTSVVSMFAVCVCPTLRSSPCPCVGVCSFSVQTLTVAAQHRLRERVLAVFSLCLGVRLRTGKKQTHTDCEKQKGGSVCCELQTLGWDSCL